MAETPGYERRSAAGKGYGVFATKAFALGETVLEGSPMREALANDAHAFQVGHHQFGHEQGLGSVVNHSCDPNCGICLREDDVFDLVCRRPLASGEEITFDYAMRNYVIEFFPPYCLCGSDLCRVVVTGWRDLSVGRKAAYRGSVAPYLLELDGELAVV